MNEKVLVTGGTGYIAKYIIADLLDEGFSIRTTMRSLKKKDTIIAGLAELKHFNTDKLEFVEANLTKDAGWSAAMKDINLVMHVASPLPLTMPKDENELIKPAKEGTLRVLKAAHQAHVKRVVMTSAFGSAGMGYGKDKSNYIFTEKDWSYMGPGSTMDAYYKSKTLAEQAAWEYIKNEAPEMELSTILPVAVFGPILNGRASCSNSLISIMLTGGLPRLMDMYLPVVDVRDLARAHVLALRTKAAAGQRFIISDEMSYSMKDVATILKQGYPETTKKLPSMVIPSLLLKIVAPFNHTVRDTAKVLGIDRKMSSKNAHDLLNWHPTFTPQQSVLDAGKSIIDAGLIK